LFRRRSFPGTREITKVTGCLGEHRCETDCASQYCSLCFEPFALREIGLLGQVPPRVQLAEAVKAAVNIEAASSVIILPIRRLLVQFDDLAYLVVVQVESGEVLGHLMFHCRQHP